MIDDESDLSPQQLAAQRMEAQTMLAQKTNPERVEMLIGHEAVLEQDKEKVLAYLNSSPDRLLALVNEAGCNAEMRQILLDIIVSPPFPPADVPGPEENELYNSAYANITTVEKAFEEDLIAAHNNQDIVLKHQIVELKALALAYRHFKADPLPVMRQMFLQCLAEHCSDLRMTVPKAIVHHWTTEQLFTPEQESENREGFIQEMGNRILKSNPGIDIKMAEHRAKAELQREEQSHEANRKQKAAEFKNLLKRLQDEYFNFANVIDVLLEAREGKLPV